VALAVLLKFLDSVDCDHSVTHASWEHSSYELLPRGTTAARGGAAANAGHAIIDEIRGCDHTFGDHDEAGCTALVVITAPSATSPHAVCPGGHWIILLGRTALPQLDTLAHLAQAADMVCDRPTCPQRAFPYLGRSVHLDRHASTTLPYPPAAAE
jgi:hypothetical protein